MKYRVYCKTEKKDVEGNGTPSNVCPNHPAHEVEPDSLYIPKSDVEETAINDTTSTKEEKQYYTVEIETTSVVKFNFDKVFSKAPMIQITPSDSGLMPDFSKEVTLNRLILRFAAKWTGSLEIEATPK